MIIGLLTDTHLPNVIRQLEELGPQPTEFFNSVDLILHGGDLTAPYVLDWLEQFAPVLCSTGNNDPIPDSRCEEVQVIDVEGWRVGMTHSLGGQFRPMSVLMPVLPTSGRRDDRWPYSRGASGTSRRCYTHQQRIDHLPASQRAATGHCRPAGAERTSVGRKGLPAGAHGGEAEPGKGDCPGASSQRRWTRQRQRAEPAPYLIRGLILKDAGRPTRRLILRVQGCTLLDEAT